MSYDVHIEIFGTAATARALEDIAAAANESGAGLDWGEVVAPGVAVEEMLECEERGDSLAFMANEARRRFPALTAACREHGLSYVLGSGEPGAEGFDWIEAWKPGMPEPFSSSADNDIPVVRLDDLRAASAAGMTIAELVSSIEDQISYQETRKRFLVDQEVRAGFSKPRP